MKKVEMVDENKMYRWNKMNHSIASKLLSNIQNLDWCFKIDLSVWKHENVD